LYKPQRRPTLSSKESKDFMEQLQQGFSDSMPKAGSDGLQKSAKTLCITINISLSN